ncbi:MAG TPA: hypothetical protein DD670_12880 [Planctomycetaceae bacterium]|nr:hypothetical protein [Planctomycetaceae bacterium]
MKRTWNNHRNRIRVFSVIALVAVVLAGAGRASSADAPAVNDAATLGPLVDEATIVVVKIDTAKLALPELAKLAETSDDLAEQISDAVRWIESFRAATGGEPVYATLSIPRSAKDRWFYLCARQSPRLDSEALSRLCDELQTSGPLEYGARLGGRFNALARAAEHAGLIVTTPDGSTDVKAAVTRIVPVERPELAAAFEVVKDWPIQILLLPPEYVRRTMRELMPTLPRHLGGGPSDVLTDGLVWAAVGIDPARLDGELIVQSRSAEAVGRLAEYLPTMLRSACNELPGVGEHIRPEIIKAHATLAPLMKAQVEGDRLRLRLGEPGATEAGLRLVARTVAATHDAIGHRTRIDQFKQIMLGMHNYHDRHRSFPPGERDRDKDGKSGLSWRVHILPQLDQYQLYKEFRLDEPWDSPHNRKLIEKMPAIYRSGRRGIKPGHTTYLAPAGEDTVAGQKVPVSIRDMTDGTTNTIMVVEVKPEWAVPWTAPDDYAFDPKDPARGLEIGPNGAFMAALGDASVSFFRGGLKPTLLLHLFQKSDGQPVNEAFE